MLIVPLVAPYVGAWIETDSSSSHVATKASHPTWVRGLKRDYRQYSEYPCSVAPYVGAWIETTQRQLSTSAKESHPTWVRGLKQKLLMRNLKTMVRRTLRGCVD